jgi:hypothetical protein
LTNSHPWVGSSVTLVGQNEKTFLVIVTHCLGKVPKEKTLRREVVTLFGANGLFFDSYWQSGDLEMNVPDSLG